MEFAHEHLFSLTTCSDSECSLMLSDPPPGVVDCRVVSSGVVELTLRAGREPGYGSRSWPFLVGGKGVGDADEVVQIFGGSPQSPIAARFGCPISMYGVDDAGFVDSLFWDGLGAAPTLRAIARRAVRWLSAPPDELDAASCVMWMEAEQIAAAKILNVVSSYRPLAKCPALFGDFLGGPVTLRREWLAAGLASSLFLDRPEFLTRFSPPSEHLLAVANMTVIAPTKSGGIYSFDLFTPAFCELLVRELDSYEVPCSIPYLRRTPVNHVAPLPGNLNKVIKPQL